MDAVHICNLALTKVKVASISALGSGSKASEQAQLIYEPTLHAVLRSHMWGFATRRVQPSLSTEEFDGFAYAYIQPADCLAVRWAESDGVRLKDRLQKVVNEDLNQILWLSNSSDLTLVYTAAVDTPNLFDPLFVKAFSFLLAADFAVSLRGKTSLARQMHDHYMLALGEAKQADMTEEVFDVDDRDNRYVDCR